ncbi:DUF2249 domain-containing protein [Sphaerotilaceae bacterium SBD11-9]
MTQATLHTIDVRQIAPRDRHPTIFSTFRCLTSGQSMLLINDHDPVPLYHQLAAEQPGGFVWEYLEAGPEQWRVAITRTATQASRSDGQCCGSCGGGH